MKDEILKFFKGEVEDNEETLLKYSKDASLLEVKPELVVFPKNSEDVRALVKWAGDNKEKFPKLSLTSRSAGTCMSGGAIGESIIIDFTRHMNAIEKIENVSPFQITPKYPNAHEITITGEAIVMPGCYYRDFEPKTLEKGLLLPCYTASKSLNALGGMVGNNSGGEKTLNYGKMEDYIKELSVVFAVCASIFLNK
jgi:FAD/FMN-containing dehydrogenase